MTVEFVSMGLTLHLVNGITVLKSTVAEFLQHIKVQTNQTIYA